MHVVPLKAHTLSQLWPTAPIHQCSPSTPHDAALNATGGGDGEADGGGGGDGEADGGGQSDEPSQNHVGSGVPSQVVPTYLQYRNPGLGGFAYQLLRTLLSHSSLLAE